MRKSQFTEEKMVILDCLESIDPQYLEEGDLSLLTKFALPPLPATPEYIPCKAQGMKKK